jgi:hypothetical protein
MLSKKKFETKVSVLAVIKYDKYQLLKIFFLQLMLPLLPHFEISFLRIEINLQSH